MNRIKFYLAKMYADCDDSGASCAVLPLFTSFQASLSGHA